METLASWSPVPELEVNSVERREPGWLVAVDSRESASCPECGTQSSSRHSSYLRTLQDLSTQGTPVTIQARVTRWRCRNEQCGRRIFAERLPTLAAPFARRTARFAGIVRLFGHSTGGRPSERLLARLGMPVSDSTILRAVKERAAAQSSRAAARVIGIDEWAWRKGMNYGTIFVDLERRRVADLLADRTTATTADWFKLHPETEIVSRDRAGMYADAARQGAPQARQVADRFHLLKNLREAIERQLGGFEAAIREAPLSGAEDDQGPLMPAVSEQADQRSKAATRERLVRLRRDAARRAMFDKIRALYEAGSTVPEIARKLGLGPRRVYRWVRRIDMPETSVMAPKPCTPAYFEAFLARSWVDGTTKVRHLFSDIRHLGYTGSYSHLARFLAPWRITSPDGSQRLSPDQEAPAASCVRARDPMTGRQISPRTAAALCVKPRGQMSDRQIVNVDALKAASDEFITMRSLALRFRGLLRGGTAERLDIWLHDARKSGIYGIRRFAREIRQDIEAVGNAVLEPWSNGQTEGQINKLKTLKRAMYGRAGIDLLRARMLPLHGADLHRE